MKSSQIILGSQSPRRKALLAKLGVEFEILTADVDEDSITEADLAKNVLARARLKAEALKPLIPQNAIVITSDTTVADGYEMLNKPADEDEAWAMLHQLRGRGHQVHTGLICIDADGNEHSRINSTQIMMRPYSDDEIAIYIASGDPMDKAGAYAVQSPEFRPVAQIKGCFTGVMGFPLCDVVELLRSCGIELPNPQKLTPAEEDDFYQCGRCREHFRVG